MKYAILILFIPFFIGCNKSPDITDDLLDGEVLFDASLYEPEKYLVSAKYPNPTADQLAKQVIIAVHGYSASTFEWSEFRIVQEQDSSFLLSQVLLGGHGTTYEEFKASTWHDWSKAIKEEYQKLEELGYTNISLVGSSTGGPLLVELISSGYFNTHTNPQNIFMIDPIVVSSNKLQSIAGVVGPMLGYVEAENTGDEKKYWYTFRPQETIQELNNLMTAVRKDLESGITLPSGTYCKVYHSKNDPTANSASTVLLYKGLKTSAGNNIKAEIMDSKIHVFTRLELRTDLTNQDYLNQAHAFSEMATRLK